MNYKPLGVAVFLAISGLLVGSFGGFLGLSQAALIEVRSGSGTVGSVFIPQAEGAQLDSAALTVKSEPFLASINNGEANVIATKTADFFYNDGALRDPGQAIESPKTAPVQNTKKALISGVVYQVNTGDTLQSISDAYNVPMSKIVQFNPSVNFSSLDPGISIIIPGEEDVNLSPVTN